LSGIPGLVCFAKNSPILAASHAAQAEGTVEKSFSLGHFTRSQSGLNQVNEMANSLPTFGVAQTILAPLQRYDLMHCLAERDFQAHCMVEGHLPVLIYKIWLNNCAEEPHQYTP